MAGLLRGYPYQSKVGTNRYAHGKRLCVHRKLNVQNSRADRHTIGSLGTCLPCVGLEDYVCITVSLLTHVVVVVGSLRSRCVVPLCTRCRSCAGQSLMALLGAIPTKLPSQLCHVWYFLAICMAFQLRMSAIWWPLVVHIYTDEADE